MQSLLSNLPRRMLLPALLLLPLLLLLRLTVAYGQTPPGGAPNTITVTGNGYANQNPDVASVSGQVQAQATTSADAVNQVTQSIQAVIAAAKAFGAADADIQTSGISLFPLLTQPVYPAPTCVFTPPGVPVPPTPTAPPGVATPVPLPPCATPPPSPTPIPPMIYAYQASEGITVRTSDLTHIGDLIGDLIGAGLTNFSGPFYSVQDPEALRARAVQAAMTDAQTIAQALATAAGVQLGPLLSVTTGYVNSPFPIPSAIPAPPPPAAFATVIPRPAPQVAVAQPGPLSGQANVTASYQILPGTPVAAPAP